MTEIDDGIRRSRGERFTTFKVFAILGLLGFMLSLLAGAAPGIVISDVLEGDRAVANAVALTLGVTTLLLVSLGIARSYGRRRGLGLRVLPDRVERLRRGRVDAIPTEALVFHVFRRGADDVERVTIASRGGRKFDLFAGEWPVARIARELERVLVPSLTERARSALAAGDALHFPERPAWSASTVVLGTLMLLAGAAIFFVASSEGGLNAHQLVKSGKFVVIAIIGAGAFLTRVVRLRGGGITLTRTGVRRAGEGADREAPFAELAAWNLLPDRVELRAGERSYRVSASGANYSVLVALLTHLRDERK